MDRWKSVLALTVAGALTAGTAFAQATTTEKSATEKSTSEKSSTTGSSATGDSMMKKSPKGTMSGNQQHVKAAQQALKDKGHDPGSIDGVMGPKTRQALKDFQKAEGLKETGRLDAETMAKLGVEGQSGAAGSGSSSSSASPRTDTGTSTGTSGSSSTTGAGASSTTSPAQKK